MSRQQYNFGRFTREQIGLTIPLAVEQLLRVTTGNINILLLGAYSDAAVAAVGVANQYITLGQFLVNMASVGAAVVISQYIGAKNSRRAQRSAASAVLLTLVLAAVVCPILMLLPRQILRLAALPADLVPNAVTYLRILGGGLAFQGLYAVLSAICRCNGHPRLPMAGMILSNLVNIVGGALVVYGPLRHLVSDVVGAVAGFNVLSTALGLVLLLVLMRGKVAISMKSLRAKDLGPVFDRELLVVGLPGGVEAVSYSLSQIVTTAMIAPLGVVALSAKTYLSSIVVYVYLIGYSFGQASQIITARMGGSGSLDETAAFVKRNARVNFALNVGISLVVFVFGRSILGWFTSTPQVIELARQVLLLDVVVQAGRALNHSYNLSLRAVGDVRFTMITMIGSTWILAVPFSWLLAVRLGFGLYGVWGAFIIDECFRGIAAVVRWNSGRWRPRMERRIATLREDTTADSQPVMAPAAVEQEALVPGPE